MPRSIRAMQMKKTSALFIALGMLLPGLLRAAAPATSGTHYYMMVYNNPIAGREEEYDHWYPLHLPDVLQSPGFVNAQRWAGVDTGIGTPPRRFLAMYKIVTDDIVGFYQGVGPAPRPRPQSAPGAQAATPSQPLDMTTNVNVTYQSLGPEIRGRGASVGKGTAETYDLFVLSTPSAAEQKKLETWYGHQFAAGVSAMTGVVSAQHFVFSAGQQFGKKVEAPTDMIIYTLVTDDLAGVIKANRTRMESRPGATTAYVYRKLGPLVDAEQARAAAAK